MKMKCLYKSVLRGDIVKAGAILDLTDEEMKLDVVKTYFVKVEDATAADEKAAVASPSRAPSEKAVVAGLTREQAIMKLNEAGAKVKGNISNSNLIAIYNQTFANVAEVSAQ